MAKRDLVVWISEETGQFQQKIPQAVVNLFLVKIDMTESD